jgi:monofunctional biosynthetic peptidoglycan transglycosylase
MDQRKRLSQKLLSIFHLSFRTFSLGLKVAILICLVGSFLFLWGFSQIPSDKQIKGCLTTEMYKVHLCPGTDSYAKLNSISPYLPKAVVLTEDGTFWNHHGFDLQEMQNSLKSNLEKGRFARGGSTISQQLAKNMFLSKDKTLVRKLIEAIITVRLEKVLTKKEIMEKYLNVVQFGKDIYGIKQASQFYFKKDPKDLTMLESAFFAFLLPSPEIYSKSFYKKKLTPFAQKRLTEIIDRLYQYNYVTDAEYLASKAELEYFLTGQEPPVMDPSLDNMDEESAEPDSAALDDVTTETSI